MSTLMKAHDQWARRAPDEKFNSLAALHNQAMSDRLNAATAKVELKELAVVAGADNRLSIQGANAKAADFTNWSFGQLCSRVKAPPSYLRELPTSLTADCLNNGLAKSAESSVKLLFKNNGSLTLRAITSNNETEDGEVNKRKYSRIWNCDITQRLLEIEARGPWQPAPAAFDGSRGLYLGDRDMFAFLVDNNRRVFEKAPGGGLSRGFFVWNSEVGSASFGIQTFLYNFVCGNHMVWGASNVREVRLRHVGDASEKAFTKLAMDLRVYADSSVGEDEAKIASAMAYELGKNKEEVLDRIFAIQVPELTMKVVNSAYDLAVKRVDWYGNPRSAWGMAGGLTEIARDLPNADARSSLERASRKVLEIAF